MKATIKISSNYGFDRNWTLVLTRKNGESKAMYLGQDVKFCNRVLDMSPSYIIEQIGSDDLTKEKTLDRLANFIIKSLGLSKTELFKKEVWVLCAE